MTQIDRRTALLVIDVQRGFDDPEWGERNNPQAEQRIAALLASWRSAGAPIVHVQHNSVSESGHFRPGTPGNLLKPEAEPRQGERIYAKSVNSAFIGTGLETDLRAAGATTLVIVGLTTNHCVSTTARMAGNLGFSTMVVADATATFARATLDGTMRPAHEVHDAALSDLHGEFAEIADSQALIDAMAAAAHAR